MIKKHFITYLMIIIFIGGVGFFSYSFNKRASIKNKNSTHGVATIKKRSITIIIQPFNNFPKNNLDYVRSELKKIYSNILIKPPIDLPKKSLNANKTRYRADSLIQFLSNQTAEGFLTIGLTEKDISTTKGEYPDWGIMGLGYCPGKSCIASTFRLKGNNKLEKLFKVAIHELGHTQGLPHCPEKSCLMRDAEGKDHLNDEKEFCDKCKRVLTQAGWALQ